MTRIRSLAIVTVLTLSVVVGRAEESTWESPIPIETIKGMVKSLQADPLGKDAVGLTALLLKYFDNMRPEFSVCLGQFKPLVDSNTKEEHELWFHVPIASGAYLLDHPEDISNKYAYQLAGIEGLVRVYETIVAAKPSRRVVFLDELVARRKAGTLGEFVRAHMCPQVSSSNYGINAPVRPVTPLAVASVAPVRPARYALRWTDKNHPANISQN